MSQTAWLIAFVIQGALHIIAAHVIKKQWIQHIESREVEWKKERKDLLDRIQAPTFQEYTNKVIREKKMEKPEEQEEPIHFVS